MKSPSGAGILPVPNARFRASRGGVPTVARPARDREAPSPPVADVPPARPLWRSPETAFVHRLTRSRRSGRRHDRVRAVEDPGAGRGAPLAPVTTQKDSRPSERDSPAGSDGSPILSRRLPRRWPARRVGVGSGVSGRSRLRGRPRRRAGESVGHANPGTPEAGRGGGQFGEAGGALGQRRPARGLLIGLGLLRGVGRVIARRAAHDGLRLVVAQRAILLAVRGRAGLRSCLFVARGLGPLLRIRHVVPHGLVRKRRSAVSLLGERRIADRRGGRSGTSGCVRGAGGPFRRDPEQGERGARGEFPGQHHPARRSGGDQRSRPGGRRTVPSGPGSRESVAPGGSSPASIIRRGGQAGTSGLVRGVRRTVPSGPGSRESVAPGGSSPASIIRAAGVSTRDCTTRRTGRAP